MQDGALAGIGHQLLVAGQPSGDYLLSRFIFGLAGVELAFIDYDINLAVREINPEPVALSQEADGATLGRFGGNVADAGARGAATKAAIGDERYLVSQTHSDNVACGREHLLHPRAAARTFIADNDDIAGLHLDRKSVV